MTATEITAEQFDQEVLQSGVPVLVDFYATWCGPCKILAPALDLVQKDVGDAAKVVKLNVDEAREVAQHYEVRTLPTLLVFKDGRPVDQMLGGQKKTVMVDKLLSYT